MTTPLHDRILATLQSKKIVLFMKGNKASPQCGFSAQVVSLLSRKGVDYLDVDVLADPDLRQGLKEFSSWPTFPQLYVNGKLIGGCDIVSGLEQSGELDRLIEA
jgi:monothiol glutaredoxin